MNGLIEYLDMGGYARYVWPAYVIVIAAIASNILMARRALRRAREAALRRVAAKGTSAEVPSQVGNAQ
ncbi:MAG: heme exporter protein CcmD [Gammaproteobacteria bacterium]